MRKKLWALNIVLLVGVAFLARELRRDWLKARWREQGMLAKSVKPAAPPPVAQTPPPPAVQATGYIDVAQQMLFSKDRNPNVVIEVEKKEKPVPAFPRFYGVMNLGDGPMAILSDAGRQRPVKAGEKVGEFLLAEIGKETLMFEWEKQRLLKKFSELQDRTQEQPVAETNRGAPPPPAPAPQQAATPAKPGPGADMGGGLAACNANDPSPAGTIVDGKRKVITDGMFGKVCRWEAAR